MTLGTERSNLKVGMRVKVAQKKDYRSGILTEGIIERILTSKETHSRGLKVKLKSGVVGRVQEIVGKEGDSVKPQSDNYFENDPDALV